ncbi:MAG: class I SAM-dependent methyltransferase [Gammaproteobacteria bacterium]|nr:class I SAM-dependent methyltransferase [Gammaproteobacteria bacterium]
MLFGVKEALDECLFPWYLICGRKPFVPGYYTAKRRAIERSIEQNALHLRGDFDPQYGRFMDERVVEYPWVYTQLPNQPGAVLDAGSALNYRHLLCRPPISNARLTIMTLAPEKRCYWNRGVSYVYGDLRATNFQDAAFNAIVSISTIEHIGLDNTLLYTGDVTKKESNSGGYEPAVREFRRLLAPGGLCLITVPFGRRAVRDWFQVFDQEMVDRVLAAFNPTVATVEYFGYGPQGWHRATAEVVRDAEFFDVQTTPKLDADWAAGARAVACIRMQA